MNKKVSMIVPIYNSENFLKECLDSIINQIYKNIEIILVNDGSLDDSEKICLLFQELDTRIKYYYIDNSGVSAARNYGLNKATGDYICFVDSDDIISPSYVLDFIEIINENVNFVCCDLNKFDLKVNINHVNDKVLKKYSGNQKYQILYEECQAYMPNRIFERKIIEENNIRFDENIHMCEDLLFNFEYLNNCESVVYLKKCNYYYRVYSSSASKVTKNKNWFSVYDVLLKIILNFDNFDIYTKRKFIYFCNTIIIEASLRRKKINDFNIKIEEERNIKKFVENCNCKMFFKDIFKYIIYRLFPEKIFKYKLEKVD